MNCCSTFHLFHCQDTSKLATWALSAVFSESLLDFQAFKVSSSCCVSNLSPITEITWKITWYVIFPDRWCIDGGVCIHFLLCHPSLLCTASFKESCTNSLEKRSQKYLTSPSPRPQPHFCWPLHGSFAPLTAPVAAVPSRWRGIFQASNGDI